jgi:hypothetical protein
MVLIAAAAVSRGGHDIAVSISMSVLKEVVCVFG